MLLVGDVLESEDRFEHTLLVSDDEQVLDGEEQERDRQEPEDARPDHEADPDEEIPDVERVSHPGEDPVGDETLDVPGAATGDGAGSAHASQAKGLTPENEQRGDDPARARLLSRYEQRDQEEGNRKKAAVAKQNGANARACGLLGRGELRR